MGACMHATVITPCLINMAWALLFISSPNISESTWLAASIWSDETAPRNRGDAEILLWTTELNALNIQVIRKHETHKLSENRNARR